MLEYDEKRNYLRMDTHCKMTYSFPQSDQIHEATCINLSGAGILFRTSNKVEPGKALEICVIPEKNITPPMAAFIEVLRSDAIEDGVYEIAASIKGVKAD